MDAVVVLKTIASMCRSYERCSDGCPLYEICICREQGEVNPELIIAAVEEWREEHTEKTRQTEFLKLVPNAYIDADGDVRIYPCAVDKKCGKKNAAIRDAQNVEENIGGRQSNDPLDMGSNSFCSGNLAGHIHYIAI